MTSSTSVATFLRRLPLTLVAAMLIWLALRPVLNPAVTGLAQTLIRSFEYPRVTSIAAVDHRAQIVRSDFRTGSKIPSVSLTEINFNTIVLLALFLALPRPQSRTQIERLFMGWCILYLTQSLNLYFHVKCLYALNLGDWSQANYSNIARNFYGFMRYFTDLPGRFSFPFLIWMGFNWDRVLELIGIESTAPARVPAKRTDKKRKKRARR